MDSAAEKQRAELVAEQAVGTSGRVANELTVRQADERTANDMDGEIRKQLNATVKNDRALQDRDINFDVNNGVLKVYNDRIRELLDMGCGSRKRVSAVIPW